jgi:hypothetical protein
MVCQQNTGISREATQADYKNLKSPTSWEDFLTEKKVVSEEQLLEFKSALLNVPVIDLREEELKPDILSLVPEPIARRHKAKKACFGHE